MVAHEIVGMLTMAVAAIGSSVSMIMCSLVQELQIPYYRLSASAELAMAFILVVVILWNGEISSVKAHEWKWVVFRGAFGSATALFAWAAVAEGAPLGDTSALGCINVVVAALLGLTVLGEPLSIPNVLALVCSLVGAVLISKPEAIFGARTGQGSGAFGHLLALASGFCSGALFIASRKSQGISPSIMSFSVFFQEGLSCWLMASLGCVQDGPMQPMMTDPAFAMVWFLGFLALNAGITFAISLGAQWCPAAASSTIFTSVSMSLGYVAQSVVHRQLPDMLTGTGAVLMLLAVALTAMARCCKARSAAACELEEPFLADEAAVQAKHDDMAGVESEALSLANFIAAEFAGSPNSTKSIRRRRASSLAVAGSLQTVLL